MNIFIKNLPLSALEQDVRELFAPFGAVESVYVVKDGHTTSKGEAYVIMPLDAEAEQAIATLNGSDFKGQQLRVVQAESADFPSGDYW